MKRHKKNYSATEFIINARTLINTPYKHQGRVAQKELDCIGLIIVAGKLTGVLPANFDFKNYSRIPDGSLERELDKHLIELYKLQIGAIALFKVSALPHHCGIITDYGEELGLLHAYENVGRVKEHALIPWWRSKIVKIYGFALCDYG